MICILHIKTDFSGSTERNLCCLRDHLVQSSRARAYPPGYPVEGQSWTIEVWKSQENWGTWKPTPNATVIMRTSLQGDLVKTTNMHGKAIFMYASNLGVVSFRARSNNLGCSWTPQQKFVSNSVALLIIGIFGIGSSTVFWETVSILRKREKHDSIDKILSWTLVTLTVVGWVLSLIWFINWKLGTEWGFGNRIFSLFNVSISFDPHLRIITLGVLVSTLLIWIKRLFFNNRKEGKRITPDYIR